MAPTPLGGYAPKEPKHLPEPAELEPANDGREPPAAESEGAEGVAESPPDATPVEIFGADQVPLGMEGLAERLPSAGQVPPPPAPHLLELGGSVGARRADNRPADVRAVQDRLLELGFLPADLAEAVRGELADPAAPDAVPQSAL